MKFAKPAGGFSGIFHMFGAYETRAQFSEKLLEMCGLIDNPDCPKRGKHRELEKAEIEKSEKAVIRVMAVIRNFTNPFEVADKSKLYNLESGSPVPSDVENNVKQAKIKGKNQKDYFIRVRLALGVPLTRSLSLYIN